jgi:two-component system OmpR family response regulator
LPIHGTAGAITIATMATAAGAGGATGAMDERGLRRPDGGAIRVLVVDDESSLSDLLSMAWRYEGWEVRAAADGSSAVRTAREFRPDAVVLDVMLPDFDGLEVLRRMRADAPEMPVLFLTARDAVEDRIAGLTAGGDDYVTKPFSLAEIVARVQAVLRRTNGGLPTEILRVADVTLDESRHEVFRGERAIELTATEFNLLRFFMLNPRRVLSKSQILQNVWHYDFGGSGNVVETYVSYLRRKLDAAGPPLIRTVRQVGYMLDAERE